MFKGKSPEILTRLNGKHDIFAITEEDIKGIPDLILIGAGPMCNDFSLLRLLPDRSDYHGPPRTKGKDHKGSGKFRGGRVACKKLLLLAASIGAKV